MLNRASFVQFPLGLEIGGVRLQVRDESFYPVDVVSYCTKSKIASSAQEPSNDAALMAMVNDKRCYSPADTAGATLREKHIIVIIDAHAVPLLEVIHAHLSAVSALFRVSAQSFGLFLSSAWVALIASAVPVPYRNSERIKRQRRVTRATCFNVMSHEANSISRIGQRLAGAINAARASLFSRMSQACATGVLNAT